MGWYSDIRAILREEPEVWLAYIHGQQLKNITHLNQKSPRMRGAIPRILLFLYLAFREMGWRSSPVGSPGQVDVLVYAGSLNQMHSLNPTVDALRKRDMSVLAIANPAIIKGGSSAGRYVPCRLGVLAELKGILLLMVRGWSLYWKLKSEHPAAIDAYFNSFCRVYGYLVYFHWLLARANPKFVVTANDHNASNRCMLAVAHYLGIKTVYMQHASVSKLFPALRVDYAFLDGEFALETYRACEPNQPNWPRHAPVPTVFLSGQKKTLLRKVVDHPSDVGIAINTLDKPGVAIALVDAIVERGFTVCLRWHPGQAIGATSRYIEAYSNSQSVRLSDPKVEDVVTFLSGLSCLVAGNSSIHLEASILGVRSIYFDAAEGDTPDYYGYVRNGLVAQANSQADLLDKITSNDAEPPNPEIDSIRYYSATVGTSWFSREGDLVAESLFRLSRGEPIKDIFGFVGRIFSNE